MKVFLTVILLALCFTAFLPTNALAQAPGGGVVKLENPIEGGGDIETIIGRAIKVALGLMGTFAFFMFIDGGFVWLTSAGRPDRVKQGAMTMLFAVIGIFVIFVSYGILNAIILDLGSP